MCVECAVRGICVWRECVGSVHALDTASSARPEAWGRNSLMLFTGQRPGTRGVPWGQREVSGELPKPRAGDEAKALGGRSQDTPEADSSPCGWLRAPSSVILTWTTEGFLGQQWAEARSSGMGVWSLCVGWCCPSSLFQPFPTCPSGSAMPRPLHPPITMPPTSALTSHLQNIFSVLFWDSK